MQSVLPDWLICSCVADAFQLTYLPAAATANTYSVVDPSRTACYDYLAAYPCGFPSAVTSFNLVSSPLLAHAQGWCVCT